MKFLGAPYPIRRHPRGLLHTQQGIQQIKSDLLVLLYTNPGERVFLPSYGTPLKKLVFEQNDAALEVTARQMIIESIRLWEPRITIQQIEVTNNFDENDLHHDDTKADTEHILGIKILFFDPENIQEVQQLVLEVPLSG